MPRVSRTECQKYRQVQTSKGSRKSLVSLAKGPAKGQPSKTDNLQTLSSSQTSSHPHPPRPNGEPRLPPWPNCLLQAPLSLPLTRVVSGMDKQGDETLPFTAVARTLPATLSGEVTWGAVTRCSCPPHRWPSDEPELSTPTRQEQVASPPL